MVNSLCVCVYVRACVRACACDQQHFHCTLLGCSLFYTPHKSHNTDTAIQEDNKTGIQSSDAVIGLSLVSSNTQPRLNRGSAQGVHQCGVLSVTIGSLTIARHHRYYQSGCRLLGLSFIARPAGSQHNTMFVARVIIQRPAVPTSPPRLYRLRRSPRGRSSESRLGKNLVSVSEPEVLYRCLSDSHVL